MYNDKVTDLFNVSVEDNRIVYRNGNFTILKLSKRVFQILEEIDNILTPLCNQFDSVSFAIEYCEDKLKRNRKKYYSRYDQHLKIKYKLV